MKDAGSDPTPRAPSREWLQYHPAAYQGPVWFRVLPEDNHVGQPHHISAIWGQWEFHHHWTPNQRSPLIFSHAKANDDHPVRLQVLVAPASRVDFGEGPPPDGELVDSTGRWRSSAQRGPLHTAKTAVFLVHGRNERRELQVARVLQNAGLQLTILHEVPNRGRTIIEKLEEEGAKAAYAVVLLTGDDEARLAGESDVSLRLQARQNVILELGYFLGKLGRERVCALYEPTVVLPSDYDGVLYVGLDTEGWKGKLLGEIADVGLSVDWHRGLS